MPPLAPSKSPIAVICLRYSIVPRLTLISAQAGFGKTTLLSDWICGIRLHTRLAWLSLVVEDNDLMRFLAYLITALQTVGGKLEASDLAMLQALQPPPIQGS